MAAMMQRDEEEHIERGEEYKEVEEEEEVSLRGRRRLKSRDERKRSLVSSPISNGDTSDSSGEESESPEGEEKDEYNELHQHNDGDHVHGDAPVLQGDGELTSLNSSVYFDQAQGTELTDGVSGIENGNHESYIDENTTSDIKKLDIQNSVTDEPNLQFAENSVKHSFSSLNPSTLEDSCEEQNASLLESKSSEYTDAIEVDQEGTDLDVERVLKEQVTHDLYCPNCRSCITRKVILLRRKRKVLKLPNKPKPNTLETVGPSNSISTDVADSSNLVNNSSTGSQTPAADEPDVFRCLSCLSFFIPTGKGFKLFQFSRDGNENEEMLNSENRGAAVKKSWFFPYFMSDKRGTATERSDGVDGNVVINKEPADAANIRPQQDGKESSNSSFVEVNQKLVAAKSSEPHASQSGFTPIIGAFSPNGTSKAATPVKAATTESNQTWMADNLPPEHKRVDIIISNSRNTSVIENPDGDLEHSPIDVKEESDLKTRNVENGAGVSMEDRVLLIDSFLSAVPDNVSTGPREIKIDLPVSVAQGPEQLEERIITIKGTADGVSVRTESGLQVIVGSASNEEPRHENAREGYQLDILKSVVYGGLLESITSLGVVSSAAGSGTDTLNILVLALANLVGGLILIIHNLKDLRQDDTLPTTGQVNEQEDRYEQLLGKRRNFTLHAVVAIVSFIVFGLVPPVLYGFLFQKSNNRDYKLAAAAGASLICITLLAIGKAHVQKPPKSYIKTIMYYLSIGFAGSGASYIAGDLLNELIEKLGWLNPSPSPSPSSGISVAMSFSDKIPMGQGWASY